MGGGEHRQSNPLYESNGSNTFASIRQREIHMAAAVHCKYMQWNLEYSEKLYLALPHLCAVIYENQKYSQTTY